MPSGTNSFVKSSIACRTRPVFGCLRRSLRNVITRRAPDAIAIRLARVPGWKFRNRS